MPLSPYATTVQSVSELTRSIRGLLETEFSFVTVSGEISNLKRPFSGHLYFTLKDSEAQIRAVLFKPQQRYLAAPLQDGMQVICRGRVSVYEPRGEYQIIADFVDSMGTGALQIAFDALKKKLTDEGLFDLARKRRLPFLPERIFLVTSPGGAALHDFLRIAANRFPGVPIRIYPVRVQGESAATEIAQAIATINNREEEGVIVLCRGGGSLEDLWAFNEEAVARAIFASRLPVVSAIGHEVDVTIADFVADHRSPTPTAAAKDVLPDRDALRELVDNRQKRLRTALLAKMEQLRRRLAFARQALGDPVSRLAHHRLRLDNIQLSLAAAMVAILHAGQAELIDLEKRLARHNPAAHLADRRRALEKEADRLVQLAGLLLERKGRELEKTAALLHAVSPLAVLGRGYAIVSREEDETILRRADQAAVGDLLRIRLRHGTLRSRVVGEAS
ncbi:MAG: exodeoxyribonuclease VII large subunit [Thermodesulfobacteriota bacterium]